MDINIWQTSNTEIINSAILAKINNLVETNMTCTYLLNISNSKFDILEKYVYDTAMYHLKRLNITETYYIEFWVKNKFMTHTLHVDCDENEKHTKETYSYPFLSCLSYFNDATTPTVISNIDIERCMYKEFDSNIELFFSFPETNKHITFNPENYHGSVTLNENDILDANRHIIAINLWTRPPSNVEYYVSNENESDKLHKSADTIITLVESNVIPTEIKLSKKILNFHLFDNILYKQSTNALYHFNDLIGHSTKQNASGYKLVLDPTIEATEFNLTLKNKYGDVVNDINEIMEKDLKYNRFLQRFTYKNIYTHDICNWIIDESEKYADQNGGWTTRRHVSYPTTDLPVLSIQSISGFIMNSMSTITSLIRQSYNLQDGLFLGMNDLFIVKYEHSQQNYLELHKDGAFLSFNILLSNNSDFEGGGTYFDDGLTSKPERGDLLIHASKIKHSGIPITKGKRYLLVGFANLKLVI